MGTVSGGGAGLREWPPFVAVSDAMAAVRHALERAALADVRVVLWGESGTGKLHAARHLHSLGSDGPFLRWSAQEARASERLLQLLSDGAGRPGTMVLERVDEASPELQGYLVAAIESWTAEDEQNSPPRIVATAARDLQELAARGSFRKDLHYLLDVFPVSIPPLRQRLEEIPAYLELFHRRLAPQKPVPRVPEAFLAQAFSYAWPGNLRELENLVAASVAETGGESWALPTLLPEGGVAEFPHFQRAKREFEAGYVRRLLHLTAGNVSRAAELAGKARKDFYALLSRNGIDAREFRR